MIVATYNLWRFGEPWQYTAERGESRAAVPDSPAATMRLPDGVWSRRRHLVVQILRRVKPDLVGLQECCCDPGAGSSQAEQIARDLDYRCAFQPILTSGYGENGTRGLAVLSRHPIRCWHEVPLPSPDSSASAAMHAAVQHPVAVIDLLVVHLTLDREAQPAVAASLLAYLDSRPVARPAIMVGDFNNTPGSATIQAVTASNGRRTVLRDAWQEARPADPGPTMPSQAPVVRLDYIFFSPECSARSARRFGQEPDADGFYPSDHLGVAASLQISPRASHVP